MNNLFILIILFLSTYTFELWEKPNYEYVLSIDKNENFESNLKIQTTESNDSSQILWNKKNEIRHWDIIYNSPKWTMPDSFMTPLKNNELLGWKKLTPEAMPGARWWWPGSAVTKEDLTWNLETYKNAGWGTMEICGIYGKKGEEDSFIDIFSPDWFEMYNHTTEEGERLNMIIDLTPSSGWKFGGPHITHQYTEQTFLVVKDSHIEVNEINHRVSCPGPGGQGLTINPFSYAAVKCHFNWFSEKFEQENGISPRAFFYDSFEHPSNWCPELPETFKKFRGYDIEKHANALGGYGKTEKIRRILCDYRETLSDLLIERVHQISTWTGEYNSKLRLQAHGAPGNLLDMYAASDYPETEVFGANKFAISGYRRESSWCTYEGQTDLINRFASSAGHVAGRHLISSESFTWLRNHYHTALSHIKAESDNLFLNGINSIFYHGVCYSPKNTAWPGWLFFAATQANYNNSIFRDIPILNRYITLCQSELQSGSPDNDILLYWPIYDLWMDSYQLQDKWFDKKELRFSYHYPEWIEETDCGKAAHWMINKGYSIDFISDNQIEKTSFEKGCLFTEGASSYQTILIPAAGFIKISTFQHLIKLANEGATILIWKSLPKDSPGWFKHISQKNQLVTLQNQLSFDSNGIANIGKGKFILHKDLNYLLETAEVRREQMADRGLRFIRRTQDSYITYFVANHTNKRVDDWIEIETKGTSAILMNPMDGQTGIANIQKSTDKTKVYLQLESGETRILKIFPDREIKGDLWPVLKPIDKAVEVMGPWKLNFIEGGPVLPENRILDTLKCWTKLNDDNASIFAGAASYSTNVIIPDINVDSWFMDLGDVRESARIWINNQPVGVLVAQPFQIDITKHLKIGKNNIKIEVTNLSANRIRDLDINDKKWKEYYYINIMNHNYEPFNATKWSLKPSGLLGPIKFIPCNFIKNF